MSDISIIIDKKRSGKYIRDIVRNELSISAGLLKKLKESGGITLNRKPATVVERVFEGDILTIDFPQQRSSEIQPVNIPLDIIYEDKYLIAVNKPKDMPTHPSAGNRDNTLGNACMYYFKDTQFVYRPVTRLDRDTTGIVIIAKDAHTNALLSKQLQNGNFDKIYYAITKGIPPHNSGIINAPIARVESSIIKRTVRQDGQTAITEYTVLSKVGDCALLELKLLTGRTHQIRVHMSHIGCPLLYDYMYGTEVPGETLYLHCGRIKFTHPITDAPIDLTVTPKFPVFDIESIFQSAKEKQADTNYKI